MEENKTICNICGTKLSCIQLNNKYKCCCYHCGNMVSNPQWYDTEQAAYKGWKENILNSIINNKNKK